MDYPWYSGALGNFWMDRDSIIDPAILHAYRSRSLGRLPQTESGKTVEDRAVKRPFQVGERVRVHDVCQETGKLCSDVGTIREIGMDGALFIDCKFWQSHIPFNPKQCRRLVKKERRRVWLKPFDVNYSDKYPPRIGSIDAALGPFEDYVEFVEVRRK